MAERSQFVRDGFWRAQSAAEVGIRAQVAAEFSAELATANLWQRFWLRRAIARETRLRLEKVAPPHGLY
ncbi:MAG TPA: hypothetical protein VHY91_09405 [Pirellulales bacterium]|jgi:hypothetical protein|nr:hypothetical protein [Pirellulales bacterium]